MEAGPSRRSESNPRMDRSTKIALGCLALFIVAAALSMWGLWAALGHGAVVYRGIGVIHANLGNEERAIHWFERAVERSPEEASLHLAWGDALVEVGDSAAAVREYEEAARLEPEWWRPLVAEARMHAEAGDYEAANRLYEQAVEKLPDSAKVRRDYARALAAQGRHEEAIEQYEKTLALDSRLPSVYFELGQEYEEIGETEEAVAKYQVAAQRCDSQARKRLAELGRPYRRDTEASVGDEIEVDEEESGEMGEAAGAMFVIGFMVVYLGILAASMVFMAANWVLACLAIWDCARRDFPDPNTRAIWCLLILLTQWLGALVYFLIIHRKNDPPLQPKRSSPPPAPVINQ